MGDGGAVVSRYAGFESTPQGKVCAAGRGAAGVEVRGRAKVR
jgi:hypothetical protein